ncbi:MAG: hypothetical protein AAGI38_24950 [Bacteroidota bacterium]
MKQVSLLLLVSFFALSLSAQENQEKKKEPAINGIGLRFATDLNYFQRANENDLVDNGFSTGVFGVFYRSYTPKRGVEIGLNINYKNSTDRGFPNLPVIMQDFDEGQNVGMTALEMDLKVGPRFGGFHPKIGYVLGYRLFDGGYLEDGSDMEINSLYLQLPFGASMSLPTGFGSVGFGAYYELCITNVMRNDGSVTGGGIFDGSRQHAVNIEIIVTYDQR